MIDRHGRPQPITDSRGCICGSLIVATSADPRELRNVIAQWVGLHPEGQALHGAMHERTTVEKARAIRIARNLEVDKSKIELR